MIKFKEIELKFNAANIPLSSFIEFAQSQNPTRSIYTCGYDHFYGAKSKDGSFIRHRFNDTFNQLTFKRKTTDKNNFIRTENNIMLNPKVTPGEVEGLCESLGYEFSSEIFKNIYVYDYEQYVLSYYVVYDKDLREQARFMEIEVAEDYAWKTEEEAWQKLTELEAKAKALGVTPQARIKKSLFEQFGG